MSIAFVFPGQGSQSLGMGQVLAQNFASAREVFEQVDDALGEKLSATMWQGPEEALNLTANTQPALMAVSLATMAILRQDMKFDMAKLQAMAGHSLGEYSAYAAAGSFSLPDTARLLRIRGNAMQAAVPVGVGAMAAILGLEWAVVQEICQAASVDGQICVPANDNSDGQVVISGHKAAVEAAMAMATERGAKRALALNVSAPFHCPLMQPAADAMQKSLSEVLINSPQVPVYANVLAAAVRDAADVAPNLVAQVVGSVRWRESVGQMAADGINVFVEVGAGKVLTGLNKRIATGAECLALNTPEDLDAFAKRFV